MMIQAPTAVRDTASDPILVAESVRYAYPQHGLGVGPIDFAANPGEVWAITGRSGCGKSTLARCLTGLIPHLYHGEFRGSVRISGLDTRSTPLWHLAEKAAMLFQNPQSQSVASTVEQEITFGLETLELSTDEMRSRCERYLERYGLLPLRRRNPNTLSGGEMQRMMLAAVMARHPRALVLDEPLSMLDTTTASEPVNDLRALADRGTTVVACEHRADYFTRKSGVRQVRLGAPASAPANAAASVAPPPIPPLAARGHVECILRRLRHSGEPFVGDLSFSLAAGEVTALVARNGVGKTTVLRALAGLHPFEGSAQTANGEQARFGLMFQNPNWQIFNASVRDEIRYRVPDVSEPLYDWLLDALSLRAYEHMPPLLLSEGEEKRLALATLLVRDRVDGILLDEPTLGQDDVHRGIMGQVARRLAESGGIVVAASHDLLWVRQHCDRVILLNRSGVVADGPTEQVFAEPRYWQDAGLIVPDWVIEAG